MSCEKCRDLCVRYAIRSPHDLHNAIGIVHENVLDGTLLESTDPSVHSISFNEVAEGQGWDDVVCYSFECTNCDEKFSLHAETYHGSGGYWEPVRKEAVRENT